MTAEPRHAHGDYLRYVIDKCRCDACREANNERSRAIDRLKAYGQWEPYIDAQPVREHLALLSSYGIGWQRAARIAGVPIGSVTKILYGSPGRAPSRRVRPHTASRILSVRPSLDLVADAAAVDGTGTTRRLQSLMALGFPQEFLASRLGVAATNLSKTRRAGRVRAATARAVGVLFEELRSSTPDQYGIPETAQMRPRGLAARNGWAVPSVWGEDIDDPVAVPAPRPERERWRAEDLLAEVGFLRSTLGLDRAQAAERLGVSKGAIEKAVSRSRRRERVAA